MKKAIKGVIKALKGKEKIPVTTILEKESILDGKVALVTGGSGGIGFVIAQKYAKCGAKVIITGRDEEKLKKCCKTIGDNCAYVSMDQSKTENLQKNVKAAVDKFGRIDILVNAAGMHVSRQDLNFLNVTERDYDSLMALNLKSTYFLTQAVAKHMIENKVKGHILMVSSNRGIEPSWSPYSLSKHGLNDLTKGLAQELLKNNIIVNGIAPGPTATGMQQYKKGDSIDTDQNRLGRYTMPEEIAEYALLLVSNLGDTIIGDTLYMSCGRGIIDVR